MPMNRTRLHAALSNSGASRAGDGRMRGLAGDAGHHLRVIDRSIYVSVINGVGNLDGYVTFALVRAIRLDHQIAVSEALALADIVLAQSRLRAAKPQHLTLVEQTNRLHAHLVRD